MAELRLEKQPAVILYVILNVCYAFQRCSIFVVLILDHLFPQLCLSLFSTDSIKEISVFTLTTFS